MHSSSGGVPPQALDAPNLLGWYVCDETPLTELADFTKHGQSIFAADADVKRLASALVAGLGVADSW